jgi:uncharacterized protein
MGPHFLASGLEIQDHSTSGRGVFATRPYSTGELLAVWGGWIISTEELRRLSDREQTFAVQVEDDLYLLTPRSKVGGADYINHSCEPNAGVSGAIGLVALRPIFPGEEIRYDYAMTDSNPDLGFTCRCGTPTCRGQVSGNDWRLPELRASYEGYFSPYLQKKIAAEREGLVVPVVVPAAQVVMPIGAQVGAQAGEDVLAHLHPAPRARRVSNGRNKLVAVQR